VSLAGLSVVRINPVFLPPSESPSKTHLEPVMEQSRIPRNSATAARQSSGDAAVLNTIDSQGAFGFMVSNHWSDQSTDAIYTVPRSHAGFVHDMPDSADSDSSDISNRMSLCVLSYPLIITGLGSTLKFSVKRSKDTWQI
jgi:hypothetical protein